MLLNMFKIHSPRIFIFGCFRFAVFFIFFQLKQQYQQRQPKKKLCQCGKNSWCKKCQKPMWLVFGTITQLSVERCNNLFIFLLFSFPQNALGFVLFLLYAHCKIHAGFVWLFWWTDNLFIPMLCFYNSFDICLFFALCSTENLRFSFWVGLFWFGSVCIWWFYKIPRIEMNFGCRSITT